MQPSPLPVRTHRFEDEATFQELMAARLRQSPWLLLSAAVHGVLLLLIWVLVPPDAAPRPARQVTLQQPDEQPIEQPKPPEKPKVDTEVDPEVTPVNDPVVSDNPVESDNPSDADSSDVSTDSAFTSDQWNTAVGLSGGAAGPYGDRGTGGGGG
ncbi:MAG: hypothetical protein KAI24_21985, partial [Planctomycetes bacterium]|nr:hypothetical protein [Planctomycetota bacterium]